MSSTPQVMAPTQSLSEKQMQKALAHHQAGRLKEAEDYYRQVLRLFPAQPDGNNLLGVLLFQTNRSKEGLEFLDKAVQLKPQESMFYYNYGVALRASGDSAKAADVLNRCIQLNPQQVDAINQLSEIYLKLRRWDDAIALLQKLVVLKPLDPQVFRKLGESLHNAKRYGEAASHLAKACGLAPTEADLQHQLGLSLQAAGDLPGASQAYKRCIELKGDIAPAHNNLAIVLAEQGDDPGAVKHYEKALELNPKLFQTRCNLGGLLRKTGDLEGSALWLQSAVDQKPDCGEAWCNLGNTLGDMGETEQAMQCYRKAILTQPDYTQARLNRSIALLRLERFEEGWVEYEWRYKLKECPRRNFPKPRWDGRELKDQVLLAHAEQGLGDTLQMLRYVLYLQSLGNRVHLECQKPLIPLLKLNNVGESVFPIGDKHPEHDMHIPLMSMPSLLHNTVGFTPLSCPYLKPDEKLVEAWREKLAPYPKKKVGIFWQGNPAFKQDRFRSIPLSAYGALSAMQDTHLISLQKGVGSEQLDGYTSGEIVKFENVDDESGAFMDTAAIMSQLDAVVTSDSAVAHLAGALGVRTCLMLPFASDWRWFMNRADCPWYPTVQLFRRGRNEEWSDVVERVVESLA